MGLRAMKEIEITPIAQRKPEKGGIKKEWIEDAVIIPIRVVAGYGGRKVAHKKVFHGE